MHELITYCPQEYVFDKQEPGCDFIETAGVPSRPQIMVPGCGKKECSWAQIMQ